MTNEKVKRTVNQTLVNHNYPYGSLKCTATFSIEFNPKKGSRGVFQTINPKTGRLNAPKKGTYSPFFRYLEEVNGFITNKEIEFYNPDDVLKLANFLNDSPEIIEELTEEQKLYYSRCIFSVIQHAIMWTEGSEFFHTFFKDYKEALRNSIDNKSLEWINYFIINPYNWAEMKKNHEGEAVMKKFTCTIKEY